MAISASGTATTSRMRAESLVGKASRPSGVARPSGGRTGVIWLDAHADFNTPETSPSGNVHGMPLAHVLARMVSFVALDTGGTLEFWGGDLASTTAKLGHVQALGADVLYLNPIHLGYTNHKYDSLDFQAVSPEFGTRDDVKALAADLHRRGMKLVLDGVFNHMGRNSPAFRAAESDTRSAGGLGACLTGIAGVGGV